MLDPNRRINKDHRLRSPRRRRMGRKPDSVPASAASRLAASRAIRASTPACTKAVFSRIPVICRARSSNSALMMSVVLICVSMATCAYQVNYGYRFPCGLISDRRPREGICGKPGTPLGFYYPISTSRVWYKQGSYKGST
jgi:hypothetical protein